MVEASRVCRSLYVYFGFSCTFFVLKVVVHLYFFLTVTFLAIINV